ncbi:MAG: hypothetical protein U0R51_09615 [Solirubrobacterales bacterium]
MRFLVTVQCSDTQTARLLTPPAHSRISGIREGGLQFEIEPDLDSPRFDEATFELTGPSGTIEQKVAIEVVPKSENRPPVCLGDSATERSSGTAPVDLLLHPWCWDPDGDPFVVEGAGPGRHELAPASVDAGSGISNWPYRTATFAGTETTKIWATDALGARSADAVLKATVGPAVSRPPECRSNPASSFQNVVYSRPGAIRRFAMICTDPDGDPLTARLSSPPERGLITLFNQSEPMAGFWGIERWLDIVYVPANLDGEPDPFSVTATGPSGDGPTARYEIVPRPDSENAGGGCWWSPANIRAAGALGFSCNDDDGDPLTVEVVGPPEHGTTAPALIVPSHYGDSDISIPYVADPGYEGYDCVEVSVSDGHGMEFRLKIDIYVSKPIVIPDPPDPPDLPIDPESDFLEIAKDALGTTAVKRVWSKGGAQVWARNELSRADLVRFRRAPGMVVICRAGCKLRSGTVLRSSGRSFRRSRRDGVDAIEPGSAHVVSLTVAGKQRRMLAHAKRFSGRFSIRVKPASGHTGGLRRSIPVGR